MELVHSQLSATPKAKLPKTKRSSFADRHRYKAYKKAVAEYADEIKEIQEDIPGYRPQFRG